MTGPDGSYEFTVSEGDYKLGAFSDDTYLPTFFDGHSTLANADLIAVAAAAPATQINLTLVPAPQGVISGRVTSDVDDTALEGVDVAVYKLSTRTT